MASNTGPKAKEQRRFGQLLMPRPKYQRILDKRPYGPGQHGPEKQFRRKREGSYGQQLLEKQKLAYIYNVREQQLRRYFRIAARQTGQTGENLLSILERRLDNLVYRAGLAPTIWAARQLVTHGHILVDGRRVDIPSYLVSPGQRFALIEKMRQNPQVLVWLEEAATPPPYLRIDPVDGSAQLVQMPDRVDIPVPINELLVVEYYNRRM